jgi:outer membrane protein assembly factor BamB
MKFFTFPALFLFLLLPEANADWPQWRGPDRNGIAAETAALPDSLPEDYAPLKLWESTGIPSDHYGGHGSIAVSGGKVYLSVVWHLDEPTETRRIDGDVLSKLGARGTSSLSEEVREKMETDRLNLSRRLRGAALDEWAETWVEEHLDEKTRLSLGSWIVSRFKKGKAAISLDVYETLREASRITFANQAEMEAWVDAKNFEPTVRDQIIMAVPNTKKIARDVVLCLDAETGEVLWRFEEPGYPSGRGSSSTPAVANGRIYSALSEHLYCIDAETGKEIWRSPLTGRKGPASSPLVLGERVLLQQNHLSAFDAASGKELWTNKDARGSNQSPAAWKNIVLCNSSKTLVGVDADSGATLWTVPGGGDGTPVVHGDTVVVTSRSEDKNLIAYQLGEGEPKEVARVSRPALQLQSRHSRRLRLPPRQQPTPLRRSEIRRDTVGARSPVFDFLSDRGRRKTTRLRKSGGICQPHRSFSRGIPISRPCQDRSPLLRLARVRREGPDSAHQGERRLLSLRVSASSAGHLQLPR